VELTGPYFHNGGAATLEQVLEFLRAERRCAGRRESRARHRQHQSEPAGTGSGRGVLKALTDDRVRYERAPFDHPSLCVPVGYYGESGRRP